MILAIGMREILITITHPVFGHLWPCLNHKILDVALLRLRFCLIGATKSDPNPGAIQVYLYFPSPLAFFTLKF